MSYYGGNTIPPPPPDWASPVLYHKYYRLRNRDWKQLMWVIDLIQNHGGTLRIALTEATERGSTQANVSAMAKLRQRNKSSMIEEYY